MNWVNFGSYRAKREPDAMQIGISAQPMVALIAEGLGLSIQKEADPAVDHFCHSLNFVAAGLY
jgi:hypothetical protein